MESTERTSEHSPQAIEPVRVGIAGIGNMGTHHGKAIQEGGVPGSVLAAVCDIDENRAGTFPEVPFFTDVDEMLSSGLIDAVIIATPHYAHTPLSISAMKAGIHVLVEKPLGVHKADCERSITAHRENGDPVFAVMFNQRTRTLYRKLKTLIDSGDLGRIRRINWVITNWFRSEAYYSSGGWRATWKGEGGGVLLNQCPHQLDLMQWLFGLPVKVRAFGTLGKYHDIEVEDDVTAYLEYKDGATGVFIASTGEAPGTNRLEITAEMGKVVVEGDAIEWTRNQVATSEFSAATTEGFSRPETEDIAITPEENAVPEHSAVMCGFVDAITGSGSLVAEGAEGIRSVELGNAMLYSLVRDETVNLPLDGEAYEKFLKGLIAGSTKRKAGPVSSVAGSFSDSF